MLVHVMYVCVPLMPLQNDIFIFLYLRLFPVWLVQYVCFSLCVCVRERERVFLDVNVLSAIHGVNSGQCVYVVCVSERERESERKCVCPCAAVC